MKVIYNLSVRKGICMAMRQFEPMSVGGILDRTFTIYRENFIRFLAIAAIVYVPIALLQISSGYLLLSSIDAEQNMVTPTEGLVPAEEVKDFNPPGKSMAGDDAGPVIQTGFYGDVAVALTTALLGIIGNALCSGALLRNISEYYLGREASVGEAYSYVLPKLATLLWASVLVAIVIMLGFLLLVVPGIIFGLWFALVTPAIVVEDLRATKAMSRSKRLASGNLGKIFGTLFVVGIISFIISGAIGWGFGRLSATLFGQSQIRMIMPQFAEMAGQIVVAPIWAVATVLLYYDLRIRKEGFDLEMMAQEMDVSEAEPDAVEAR
jgi:hypothetical protein